MEGAIVLLIIILLGILVIPIFLAINTNNKVGDLRQELNLIKNQLRLLNETLQKAESSVIKQEIIPSIRIEPTPEKTVEPAIPSIRIEPILEKKQEPVPPIMEKVIPVVLPTQETIKPIADNKEQETIPPTINHPIHTPPPRITKSSSKTNLEQFIAEKLISIVGIAILVLGIFFTVKWAIDRNLITNGGKVLIGLFAGTILIAVAHRLSKNYRAFSSILAGGGVAVLYFTIYEAYQAYHLFSQTAAFSIMILVTILAVTLSVIYNKKELAIIALVGGFSTPFFVSNGSGNYQILFTYMLILNVGMFVLASFKKWNIINILSYAATILIFGGWMGKSYDITKGHNLGGFIFATLFYLVFFGMNLVYNLKNQIKFAVLEISLLLSTTFLYMGIGLYCLHTIQNGAYEGLFCIGFAVFNFIFAFRFYKQKNVDKNLIYLLIGLVLTFVNLTGPLQLHGNYITLFWACEMALLYWLGIQSNIELFKNGSIAILILTIISLSMDWQQSYYTIHVNKLNIIFNKVFITGLVVLTALYTKILFLKKDQSERILWSYLNNKYYKNLLQILFLIILYLVGIFELQYQTYNCTRLSEYMHVMIWVYHYLFLAILYYYTLRNKNVLNQQIISGLAAISLLLYLIANAQIIAIRNFHLIVQNCSFYYSWHYLIPVLALFNCYLIIQFIRKNYEQNNKWYKASCWFISATILTILSSEIIHIWVSTSFATGFSIDAYKIKAIKVALPVCWSLLSLIIMLLGMRKKIKLLRIIALCVFTITILKLFLYDISTMGQGAKIVAFILLGIILLTVSFLYQKIKGLFIDDTNETLNEK